MAIGSGTGRREPKQSNCGSQANEGERLPRLARTAASGRKGANGGGPVGLCLGQLDPHGARLGQSHGHERHFQELGQPIVQRHRQQGEALPRPPPLGDWLYLWIDVAYLKVRRGGRTVSG
jgi:hypothetical protein